MAEFVDHLQLLPMPFEDGRRQPDGDHRPGGLGLATLSDRLERRGWTARVEDLGFDKPMSESRLAEAFARAIGDGVESARERRRFPIVLGRSGYAAVGVVDALGAATGVVWASARADYANRGILRRPAFDACSLALLTGRAKRDPLAMRQTPVAPGRVIVLGAGRASAGERRTLAADGIRVLAIDEIGRLPAEVAATDAEGWYLHVDLSIVAATAVPGAARAGSEGVDPPGLCAAIGEAFGEGRLRCTGIVGYDLNADPSGATLETVLGLVEAAAVAAGGVPRPETVGDTGG